MGDGLVLMQQPHLTLDDEAQKRAVVLTKLLAGDWTNQEAAEALGLSQRQLRRLKKTFRREGAAGLVHGNQGRRPVNAVTDEVRAEVVTLAQNKYVGFNQQHLTEKLAEDEGLLLSRSTVRRIVTDVGLPTARPRRAPKHRGRRERLPQEGMLLQADGSRHQWLGDEGPWLTLIGGIDDATGTVPYALFREQEDAAGYMAWLQQVVLRKGVPLTLYIDRHSIFIKTTKRSQRTLQQQLSGQLQSTTQFGRVLQELGVTPIYALSPQGKGRVERLWGTLQDRLTSELRLAGVTTLGQANLVVERFLPAFNERFGVPAAQPGSAYRPLPAGFVSEEVFCFKYGRLVEGDNTVRLGEHRLQLLANRERASYVRARVEVQERLDGSLAVFHQGRQVAHKPAPAEAPLLRARRNSRVLPAAPTADPTTAPQQPASQQAAIPAQSAVPKRESPAYDHPWRKSLRRQQPQPASGLPADVELAVGALSEELHEPRASRTASLSRAATLLVRSTLAPGSFVALLHQARDKTLHAHAAGRIVGRQVDGRPKLMAYLFAVLENDLERPNTSAPLVEPMASPPPRSQRPKPPAPAANPDVPPGILRYVASDREPGPS
jgi:transposase